MKTRLFVIAGVLLLLSSVTGAGQDKTTGSIKGKVRVEKGTPDGVVVVLRQGEKEISRTLANRKGEFVIARITPGIYGVSFRKPGLAVGSVDDIEVRAGKTRSLPDRIILGVDDGSIAFIRGSVFTEDGRSAPGVRIELGRILGDGSVKKLDARITNETGQFVFRLPPDLATYRLTLKADRAQPESQDVEVDGAAVYRRALTLKPATN